MNNENSYAAPSAADTAVQNLLNADPNAKDGLGKYGESDRKAVTEDVCSVAELLPPQGVEPFFKSRECLLCKGEHKHPASCYARLMLGHINKNAGSRGSRRGYNRRTGMIIPLQIASCEHCRGNLTSGRYLPICIGLLVASLALALVSTESVRLFLESYAKIMPLLVFLIITCIGAIIATLVSKAIIAHADRESIRNPEQVPGVRELLDRGWFIIKNDRQDEPFVFSKKRMQYGLCTGDGQAEAIAAITGQSLAGGAECEACRAAEHEIGAADDADAQTQPVCDEKR